MVGPFRAALPQRLVDQAQAYAVGARTPSEPRNAATVVLLRPSPDTPTAGSASEVYLLRRHASMDFAGGMCVFPGGGVDRRDFEYSRAWTGQSPERWAEQLACSTQQARALLCAAVRETFEESGVLLAGASADEVVGDTTGADWEADRAALESRDLSMSDFLARRELVLRTDLLGAYAAWTTPVFEPKRFATWFFVAVLPPGQRTRDVSRESEEAMWVPADQAVARVDSGAVSMLPPTYVTCLDVARLGPPQAVLGATEGRRLEMFTPEVERVGEGFGLSVPPQFRELLR